jgi:hypothetical protein
MDELMTLAAAYGAVKPLRQPVDLEKQIQIAQEEHAQEAVKAFVETEQGVVISPQEVIAMEALDQIGQILREKGLTPEELIESGREIRGKILEEEYGLKAEEG